MNIKNENFCKLIYLNDNEDFNILIKEINEILNEKKNKKKYRVNNIASNDNNMHIYNIEKIDFPDWYLKCNYKTEQENKLNITQNRIILYKYDEFIVYLEKNGQFKKLNNLFEKYNNINILYNEKNINDIEKLRNFIKEFILNKKEVLNSLNTFCNQLNISLINYLNDNEYSYNNFINLYNDLIINKN